MIEVANRRWEAAEESERWRPEFVQMPSGLLVGRELAEEVALERRRMTCVDVFAGCGGMSLGVIQAGMEVVAAIENDAGCVITYMTNLCRYGRVQVHCIAPEDEARLERYLEKSFFPQRKSAEVQVDLGFAGSGWISNQAEHVPGVSHIIVGDVRAITGAWLLGILGMRRAELGCMCGGPPCQGFSTSGKRNVMDPRNSLVFEFARLIVETMPQTMIMENVPGILTMKTPEGQPVVERFCQILRDGGFHGVEAFERAAAAGPGRVGVMRQRKMSWRKTKGSGRPELQLEPELVGEANAEKERE